MQVFRLKKAVCFAVAFVVISLCSCTSGEYNANFAPLDKMIDGQSKQNAGEYLSAFHSSYSDLLSSDEERMDALQEILDGAAGVNEANYGERVKIRFKILSDTVLDEDGYMDYTSGYVEAALDNYDMPAPEESRLLSIEYLIKGKDGESINRASFVVVRYEGELYLHPMYMFYMFS